MILGVGVDIVEISRMGRLLRSPWAEIFVNRVFSQEEIRACRESAHPAEGFSARFAAKEAVSPDQIIVKGGEHAQPSIILEGYALEIAESMQVGKIHVSLTHSRNAACAFVVIERRRQ